VFSRFFLAENPLSGATKCQVLNNCFK